MAISLRIEPSDGQLVDRDRPVSFIYNGAQLNAFAGDTVGSALAAAGVRTVSRSFKYHRPRGLLCVAGRCPNCLVTADGSPNVRACTTPITEGMIIKSQNAWPSVDFDAISVLDRADRLMPVGFYYKAFHRPKPLWDVVRPIIRAAGGLGKVNPQAQELSGYAHRSVHIDVLVVGAGHAGMSAAIDAAEAGAQVVLVNEQPTLGAGQAPGEVAELVASVKDHASIETWSNSTGFGFYADNLVTVLRGQEVLTVRAGRVVLATGSHEVPFVFPGNDLPGVMLGTGAIRLMRMYGVLAGTRAVVATEDDSGYAFASELMAAGIEVAAVLDTRTNGSPNRAGSDLPRGGDGGGDVASIRLETGAVVIGATGKGAVKDALFAVGNGPTESIDCDLLLMAGRLQPAAQLALQAGCSTVFHPAVGTLVPTDPPQGVTLVGGLIGAIGSSDTSAGQIVEHDSGGKKQFICMCEDISKGDLTKAVAEGFGDIQILKRYSTTTMGPCQGKMCLRNFSTVSSKLTNVPTEAIGLTTMRPPSVAMSLGALAGPGHLPVKRTALHHRHIELGAEIVDAGGWQRPYSYGDAASEAKTVRERVGIIDVSTLGKLDVRGPDAPRLLDFLYTNRMSNLRVGRIRYGVMCLDDGTILDDGTVTRLSEDRFFVTTTTGNIELIEQWYKWWIATEGDMTAHIADVTSGFAAINVAGPHARELLSRLTDADLSPDAFEYMRSAQAEVAGVAAILLRIGFVGETGWEIHFPSQYAGHMWDALTAAGRDFGLAPFGLEAQRILRLEKGHIIVNQDTDSITTPIEGGMGWAVRLAKKDFVGRGGLRSVVRRGPRQRLVGFVMDPESPVPKDGSPIVHDGSPVGRVTSARLSPTGGMPFGLAMVPTEMARDGVGMHIPIAGELWAATVQLEPVYDPAGARLRG